MLRLREQQSKFSLTTSIVFDGLCQSGNSPPPRKHSNRIENGASEKSGPTRKRKSENMATRVYEKSGPSRKRMSEDMATGLPSGSLEPTSSVASETHYLQEQIAKQLFLLEKIEMIERTASIEACGMFSEAIKRGSTPLAIQFLKRTPKDQAASLGDIIKYLDSKRNHTI